MERIKARTHGKWFVTAGSDLLVLVAVCDMSMSHNV